MFMFFFQKPKGIFFQARICTWLMRELPGSLCGKHWPPAWSTQQEQKLSPNFYKNIPEQRKKKFTSSATMKKTTKSSQALSPNQDAEGNRKLLSSASSRNLCSCKWRATMTGQAHRQWKWSTNTVTFILPARINGPPLHLNLVVKGTNELCNNLNWVSLREHRKIRLDISKALLRFPKLLQFQSCSRFQAGFIQAKTKLDRNSLCEIYRESIKQKQPQKSHLPKLKSNSSAFFSLGSKTEYQTQREAIVLTKANPTPQTFLGKNLTTK